MSALATGILLLGESYSVVQVMGFALTVGGLVLLHLERERKADLVVRASKQ